MELKSTPLSATPSPHFLCNYKGGSYLRTDFWLFEQSLKCFHYWNVVIVSLTILNLWRPLSKRYSACWLKTISWGPFKKTYILLPYQWLLIDLSLIPHQLMSTHNETKKRRGCTITCKTLNLELVLLFSGMRGRSIINSFLIFKKIATSHSEQ